MWWSFRLANIRACDLYTQALLHSTNDLAEVFDGTRVHDPRGGTYEPQERDLVPWLGRVPTDQRVVNEGKQRRRIGQHLEVAKQELHRARRRGASWDVGA
jgi:hypothetical protein